MKDAIMLGAMMFLTACPKGGTSMSTETGGPGGGESTGGGGGGTEGARSFGDTGGCRSRSASTGRARTTTSFATSTTAAKIKGFRCGYGKPRSLTMDNGIVVYMGNNEESNFSDWAKPWLMKNL